MSNSDIGTYTEYKFSVNPSVPGTEILIVQLSEVGFESFQETDSALLAYAPTKKCPDIRRVSILDSSEFTVSYETRIIPSQDWNHQWESQFQPVEIDHSCRIRASFHPKKEVDYDIVINPKMAFGTGHHPTTHLMMLYLLETNVQGKTVLDMGCGTGVLSVLASKKHAKYTEAIDIDTWSYENTKENIALNHCRNITVFKGDSRLLKSKHFDIIFANITRNVLLADMPMYFNSLEPNGLLFLSGFYKKDLDQIEKCCRDFGLIYQNHKFNEDWIAAKFMKTSEKR